MSFPKFPLAARFSLLALLAALVFTLASPVRAAKAPVSFDGGRIGHVPVVLPKGKPSDVVFLFVDKPTRGSAKQAVSKLNALGAAVAVIDTGVYMKGLKADAGDGSNCLWLSSEVEELNLQIQRKLAFPQFRLPVLASSGQGGVLVYTLLAEAPSYSFAGGVSLDFTPAAAPNLNFCGIGKPESAQDWLPAVSLNLPWQVEPSMDPDGAIADWIDDVDKAGLVAPLASLSGPDHVAALVKPMLDAAVSKDPNSLEDLPLIEMPAEHPAPYIAIIYSGDGGWRDLDRTLGQVLQANNVPVVGVDSLLYFWQPKRPEIVAHDLDRIVEHYRQAWKINHFVLIGYSFGADILPFAYNRMSPDEKSSVGEISLLALSRNTRFEISVSEYFSDDPTTKTQSVVPELHKIPPALVQCFYGEEEAETSACTAPDAAKTELIETEGGHHFGDDYDVLAKKIMDGALKRLK